MAAIATVCDDPHKRSAYLLFKSWNNLGERVTVIGISWKGRDMSNEVSAF